MKASNSSVKRDAARHKLIRQRPQSRQQAGAMVGSQAI